MKLQHIFCFGNTILDLDRLHDLRVILKAASQSPLSTHRERATALEILIEIDDMVEDLTAEPNPAKAQAARIEFPGIEIGTRRKR